MGWHSTRPRSYYGIPDSMEACPCGDEDCMYFDLGYPYCHGCDQHHRTPVAAAGERCPVDVDRERWEAEEAGSG